MVGFGKWKTMFDDGVINPVALTRICFQGIHFDFKVQEERLILNPKPFDYGLMSPVFFGLLFLANAFTFGFLPPNAQYEAE